MTSIRVPSSWVAAGTLPPACARHGKPATHWQKRRFYTRTPAWIIALVLVALLIAIIVSLAIRRTVHGNLPACADCTRDRKRFVWSVIGAWVLDVVLIAVLANTGGIGIVVWLLATLAALIYSFSGDRFRVGGQVSKDTLWVELRGVHPSFAAALAAALAPQPAFAPAAPVMAAAPMASPAPIPPMAPASTPVAPVSAPVSAPVTPPAQAFPAAAPTMTILPGG